MLDNDKFVNSFIIWCRNNFDFQEGKVRLEVGSGPHGSFHIRDNTLIGTDPLLNEYIKLGYSKWFTPVLSTEDKLPFPNNTWEDVYFLNVLDHCEHRETIINELYRIMTIGGKLYFFTDLGEHTEPCHYVIKKKEVINLLKDKFDISDIKEIKSPHRGCQSLYGVLIKKS